MLQAAGDHYTVLETKSFPNVVSSCQCNFQHSLSPPPRVSFASQLPHLQASNPTVKSDWLEWQFQCNETTLLLYHGTRIKHTHTHKKNSSKRHQLGTDVLQSLRDARVTVLDAVTFVADDEVRTGSRQSLVQTYMQHVLKHRLRMKLLKLSETWHSE